ncbi:hypothetical protein [Bacillus sp. RAR_GA_16]|uniref:hypothetical protein n=1 Tax=Bacillus sp. RAR_GA_16 TaxID=2876774 RepID=UPI001CCBE98C|nr:hypothetical protein [Bacillus sp. RAR_GA_16]MCA0171354.1 hypothetical protein [Bacillus sp. RAR_GA_16]
MKTLLSKIVYLLITSLILYGFFKVIQFVYNKYIPYSFATDVIGVIVFVIICIPLSLVISHNLLKAAGK